MLRHVESVASYTKISMFRKDSSCQKCRKEQVVVAIFQQITDNGHISLGSQLNLEEWNCCTLKAKGLVKRR